MRSVITRDDCIRAWVAHRPRRRWHAAWTIARKISAPDYPELYAAVSAMEERFYDCNAYLVDQAQECLRQRDKWESLVGLHPTGGTCPVCERRDEAKRRLT